MLPLITLLVALVTIIGTNNNGRRVHAFVVDQRQLLNSKTITLSHMSVNKRNRINDISGVVSSSSSSSSTNRFRRDQLHVLAAGPDDDKNDGNLAGEKSFEQEEPVKGSLNDSRCLEWYKQQPGAMAQPALSITALFAIGLKALQTKSEDDLTDLAEIAFIDEGMAKAFVKFVLSSDVKAKIVPATKETLDAFRLAYVDANDVVDDFIEYINDCHKEYKNLRNRYVAPFTSLCQSSGYGKSRLLEQVSQKRKLLYVCVGDAGSDSFPGPNIEARDFLFSKANDETLRQTHLVQQLKRCISWCKRNDLTMIDQFGNTPSAFWNDLTNHYATEPDKAYSSNSEQDETIWIAFDEARSLLKETENRVSDFQILRRALAYVSTDTDNQIFAILVDTKSAISSFSPGSKSMGASARMSGKRLFRPYILLSTHDAFKDPLMANDVTDDWSFVNCGRPLWKSLFPNLSHSAAALLDFAGQKLSKSESTENIMDDLALLAIIMCRTGVYLSPQSSTATELAANYMATLLLCDHTHEHFLVTYLSDPVLTVASAKLWYKTKDDQSLVTRALLKLRQKMVYGAVVEGFSGELVGRLLLLLGMDSTSKGGSYDGGWYKVSDFMECCFGVTDCLVGEEAFMGFSHFIPLVNEPTSYQDLQKLLYRRGAYCLPRSQNGVDLLIPFWKKGNAEPLISYILVQIKNRQSSVRGDIMRHKLNPKLCFSSSSALREPSSDVILIMMQIGLTYKTTPPKSLRFFNDTEVMSDKPADRWKNWVYSMRGIYPESYPFLRSHDTLRDELVRMRTASLNVDEWMANDESENDPPTLPGMDRRRKLIRQIDPEIVTTK